MENYMYPVAKIEKLLGVHNKTVLRYIKEGKLKAKKVGGRWRIHGNDLSKFVGSEEYAGSESTEERKPQKKKKTGETPEPWVSTVVHGENIDQDDAIRISNTMLALMNSRSEQDGRGRLDTVYFEDDLKIQVLIWGSIDFTRKLLKTLRELMK